VHWPQATLDEGAFSAAGRAVRGFELAPVNLELMAEGEREAALEALAALYDAVPRPFTLLSVPASRPPHEHLGAVEERLASRRARDWYRPYAALYRELAAAPRRPLRRAYLLLDAPSAPELDRAAGVVGRMAEEQGTAARPLDAGRLAALWADLARVGATYRVGAGVAVGDDVLGAAALARRWPAEVEPGWLGPLLAVPGVASAAMRVRPLSRPEAMAFLTTRLRQVRAAERVAAERGELADVARERLGATAVAGRRRVHAAGCYVWRRHGRAAPAPGHQPDGRERGRHALPGPPSRSTRPSGCRWRRRGQRSPAATASMSTSRSMSIVSLR
jgi:hypothetical protein